MKNLQQSVTKTALTLFLLSGINGLSCDAENSSTEDVCADELPPTIDLPAELGGTALYIGELSADEWVEQTGSASTTSGMLGAYLADFTEYEDELIPAIPFNLTCVGEVGKHIINVKPTPMDAETVSFIGLPSGAKTLQKNAQNLFDNMIVDGAIFSLAGGEELTATVTSTGAEGMYPSFTVSAVVPPAIVFKGIENLTDGSLEITWIGAETAYFEVSILAESTNPDLPQNRLRCLLADDGCLKITAEAMEWLWSGGAQTASIKLTRHVLAYAVPQLYTLGRFDLTRSMSAELFLD